MSRRMGRDDRFDDIDAGALKMALLALRTCPKCRDDLRPVAYTEDVYGCPTCRETWHLPGIGRDPDATIPLCPDCMGAIGGACGGPDAPYRPAKPGEPCGAADHEDDRPDAYEVYDAGGTPDEVNNA